MTELELLDETLEYYTGHPERFAKENRIGCTALMCVYKSKGGQMCAVGRCAKNIDDIYWQERTAVMNLISESFVTFQIKLKREYRNIHYYFWKNLQRLHDERSFWTRKAQLTEDGLYYVYKLRRKYSEITN